MINITEKEDLKNSTLFNIDELKCEIKYWNKGKFLLPFGFYLNIYGHKKSLIKYYILMASFLIIFITATLLTGSVLPFAGQIISLSLSGGIISFLFFMISITLKIKNHITKEEINRRLEAFKAKLETEKQNLLNLDKSNKSTNEIIIE